MLLAGLEPGEYSIVYPRNTFGISVKSGRPPERGGRTQSVKAQRYYRWINAMHLYVDRTNFGEAGADGVSAL